MNPPSFTSVPPASRRIARRARGSWALGILLLFGAAAGDLLEGAEARLLRGPYLQLPLPTTITVRWRTDEPGISRVQYGTEADNLYAWVEATGPTTNHSVMVTNLQPGTFYYYSIGLTNTPLTNGPSFRFRTPPAVGSREPFRVWVLGDSGYTNFSAGPVRDAYYNFTTNRYTDLWVMLGDNAYTGGTDGLYQNAVFNTYPTMLRQTPLLSTIGNQETMGSANPPPTMAYLEIFSLPMNAELGGIASGSERYYSFDYANVHFVCLDSMSTSRATNSAMYVWLQSDLENNTNDWLIAFWHHPPYSKGSNDSDARAEQIEMRNNFLPLLEAHGVDLVLSGHSHSYERSFLLDGHYGLSSTFDPNSMVKDGGDGRVGSGGDGAYAKPTFGPARHEGAVYLVSGSGSQVNPTGTMDHPAMYRGWFRLGSVALDIHANRLDAKFIRETGAIEDEFTLVKGATPFRILSGRREGGLVQLSWSSIADRGYRVEFKRNLTDPDWEDRSGLLRAQGPITSWSGPAPTEPGGFYRIWSAED